MQDDTITPYIFDNEYFQSRVVPCACHLHPIFYCTIFSSASLGVVFEIPAMILFCLVPGNDLQIVLGWMAKWPFPFLENGDWGSRTMYHEWTSGLQDKST